MKKWHCDACGKEIEIYDEYNPEMCCDGRECGCMGMHVNPIFCNECEEKFYGTSTIEDKIKPQD